jgi:phosphoenolpyruvate-protein phosphotransferase (PTS system enzyme I)
MTLALHGISVSRGIAIGRALVWGSAQHDVPRITVREADIPSEQKRFDCAVAEVLAELANLRKDLPADTPPEVDALLNLHALILRDPALSEQPKVLIAERKINAEWALIIQKENLMDQFEAIEDSYLRERNADIRQLVERVMKSLRGAEAFRIPDAVAAPEEAWVLVAHDISPADMMQLRDRSVAAFVTDVGGATSHTAILARSLNIPAVVGVVHGSAMIRHGEMAVVDGKAGVALIDPDDIVLEEYRRKKALLALSRQRLERLKDTETQTACGSRIELYANIELPEDVKQVMEAGADGIGLFRSEFLFMNRKDWPSEDEQYESYSSVVKAMKGRPVTVRTLDLGADKTLQTDEEHAAPPPSTNTALGLRSIRFCLAEPTIFLTQLRAILRASRHGPLRILLPMISTAREIQQSLDYIAMARQQLQLRGITVDDPVPVGAMVEVPAAALCLPMLTSRMDFLSVGTNDLIQYVLAIDRVDASVAHMYDPLHPAVLRLLNDTILAGRKAGIPVSVCGEMAGDVKITRLLLGMGLKNFSVHASQLLDVKEVVLKTTLADIEKARERGRCAPMTRRALPWP